MKKIVACNHAIIDPYEGVAALVMEFQDLHPGTEIEVHHNNFAVGVRHYSSLLLIAREATPADQHPLTPGLSPATTLPSPIRENPYHGMSEVKG